MKKIPENIQNLINQINESEDRWKALFMATWGLSYQIRGIYENTPLWNVPIKFGLPASKKKCHEYTPENLHRILTTRDPELSIIQTQFLFMLLEDLVKELYRTLNNGEEINADSRPILVNFLKDNNFLYNHEEQEFILAKETRNCFLHQNNKIDGRWIEQYEKTKNVKCKYKIGDRICVGVQEVEEWTWLIMNIAKRIENFLLEMN